MRTFLIGVFLIGIVTVFLALRKPLPVTTKPALSPTPTLSLSPSPTPQSMDIDKDGNTYRVAWLTVADPSRLFLIPNFTQKRTARSLVDGNQCDAVINGGFYTKGGEPTGLFIADGKTIRQSIPNTLLNGYFLVDTQNRAAAVFSLPDQTPRIGLQSGPILMQDGRAVKLSIRDDEFARRVVVGVTQNGSVMFLALYDPDNPGSGPRLADTPEVLAKFISRSRLDLRDILNLDGGSASAFIREGLSLEELTSVGSFFCIK